MATKYGNKEWEKGGFKNAAHREKFMEATRRARLRPDSQFFEWTKEQEKIVRENLDDPERAFRLIGGKRTLAAIKRRSLDKGWRKPKVTYGKPRCVWTNKDEIWLEKNYEMATKAELIERFPGHTYVSICYRASQLGLRRWKGGHKGARNKYQLRPEEIKDPLIRTFTQILWDTRTTIHDLNRVQGHKFAQKFYKWKDAKGYSPRLNDLRKILAELEYELVIQPMDIKLDHDLDKFIEE